MINNSHREDFFKDYRERYNQYWVRRFGMIPHLPTSLDNSNSIYELLAWLQRAFKGLLDDFINQQLEFEQFKNNLLNLLEVIIPDLIRQFTKSDEFKEIILNIIEDWYNKKLKPILDEMNEKIDANSTEIQKLKETINDLKEKLQQLDSLIERVDTLERVIEDLKNKIKALENDTAHKDNLNKIIDKLAEIGVWDKNTNNFKNGMGIAGGNINLFGGKEDGTSYIRTNNGKTENDLVGGI